MSLQPLGLLCRRPVYEEQTEPSWPPLPNPAQSHPLLPFQSWLEMGRKGARTLGKCFPSPSVEEGSKVRVGLMGTPGNSRD